MSNFYKVNIVNHALEYSDDKILKTFNPCANKSDNYLVEYLRIDILVKKDDLLDYDHACLLNLEDYSFKQNHGLACPYYNVRVKKIIFWYFAVPF